MTKNIVKNAIEIHETTLAQLREDYKKIDEEVRDWKRQLASCRDTFLRKLQMKIEIFLAIEEIETKLEALKKNPSER